MEMVFRSLHEYSFEEATQIWNRCFEGYLVDATMTVDRFVQRMGIEGLSPARSLVAVAGEEPVGIVLNGLRTVQGRKAAWNGGTGVAVPYRGKGLGTALLEATMALYQREQVEIATLEAFEKNKKAISLYEKMGYRVVDRLLFLEKTGTLDVALLKERQSYRVQIGSAGEVSSLSFYPSLSPWQTDWEGIKDGMAAIVRDGDGESVGYALFKRVYHTNGTLEAIILYQCRTKPGANDPDAVIRSLIQAAFSPLDTACKRSTFNLSTTDERVVRILESVGFTHSLAQVWMVKKY
ncbi:GNAT family N-acetyltransferase [Desmospora activa]|uniref:Acetyltransferase (GNAT) family protein n=1 Tax=Desmospora activa DSM 45169 TaxID=1121389 RepID=A0A2T4ZBZ5_9BACL|nr:GNAT family N-acetyltransferase [Desmospora activa]PTM59399.1 acetyltransferase (GNAT) family protein [Desmospora activa DSM 45169]